MSHSKPADKALTLSVYIVTTLVYFPVLGWLYQQTANEDQLLHALMILGFVSAMILIERKVKLALQFNFSKSSQLFLVASYGLLIPAILLKFNLFILFGMGSFLISLALYLFGEGPKRAIYSVLGTFTCFTAIVTILPILDWPLRTLAGTASASVLELLGQEVSLGLYKASEPVLLLFNEGRPFRVAAECNGFGIITATLLISLMLVIYLRLNLLRAILTVFISIIFGFIMNTFRIVIIVILAPKISDSSYDFMHEAVGTIILMGSIAAVWFATKKKPKLNTNPSA